MWKNFLQILVTTVARLLPIIDEMNKKNLGDVMNIELHQWYDMISNCEALRFNMGWIRRRLEFIKTDRASILANMISFSTAIMEEEGALNMESVRVDKAIDDLRVRTESFQR